MNSKPSTTTIKCAAKTRLLRHCILLFAAIGCLSNRAHASSCSTKKPITMVEIATYDEVKDLPNHPEKVLIDVREPEELKETGQIPTSINIPRKALVEEGYRHSFILNLNPSNCDNKFAYFTFKSR